METIDNFKAITDEQITDLAHELADKLYNDDSSYNSTLWWCEEPKERKAKELKHTLRFLSERFCLVEKEVVRKEYASVKDAPEECDYEGHGVTWDRVPYFSIFYDEGYECGQKELLESLFPEIAKEVEG